jgi:hypothetical protein
MVRFVPAVHSTDSAIVRAMREAQHAHRESPRRSVDTYRPSSIGIGERSRETVLGARAVAIRADAMRHARMVLGIVGPGEEGPEPSAASVFAMLADPATVGALRTLAVAGMRCVVSRSNARGEVSTVYRPVDAFGREASEAIGSLWMANATQSWRHGAPTTATGIVAYLRTIVRRMSRPIAPRARKGGPAAPLPLVTAADVVAAGGLAELERAEKRAAMLGRVARLPSSQRDAVQRMIDAGSMGGLAGDTTAHRALRSLRAVAEDSEEDFES